MGNKRRISRSVLGFIIMLLFMLPLSFCKSPARQGDDTKLRLVYFYENVCGSCNPEGEFIDFFNNILGDEKEGVEIELSMHNVFHDSGLKLLEEYYEDFNVPKDRQLQNMLFIGNSFLSGKADIEKGLKDEFTRAKASLGREKESNENQSTSQTPTIIYFHVTACSSCREVEKFLKTFPDIDIREFNISDSESLNLIKRYFEDYTVPEKDQSVPIVFIGDFYLSGEKTIRESLTDRIDEGQGLKTRVLVNEKGRGDIPHGGLSGYGVVGVLITGFVNGLNPCSISMLLFFLSILTMKNISALKMGFAFITGKFITYFLLGTLLFNIFTRLDIPWFHTSKRIIMAIILFAIALINIGDLLASRKEDYSKIRMQLPTSLRKINHEWIKKLGNVKNPKILMPISFGLGILISFGEFLCTGQIYLATIVSVLRESRILDVKALFYFSIYGCAFIFPPVLITILIHKGRELFDITEWIREKMPAVKIINAVIFILFAIFTLVWF